MNITPLTATLVLLLATSSPAADSAAPAASAINSLGIDLLRQTGRADANALLSPYSIETALVMTYAGADGVTRDEMARVLHLTNQETQVRSSFDSLQRQINDLMQRSAQVSAKWRQEGITNDPINLTVANRLFGQLGFAFHGDFLNKLKADYDAPFKALDFRRDPDGARKSINDWIEQQTKRRIQNLIPEDGINDAVRLVLADAIYFKAPWEDQFLKSDTKPSPFHVAGGVTADVPTMGIQRKLGYMKFNGFTAVTVPYQSPYEGDELQFLILLPDASDGLVTLEKKVAHLDKCANLPERQVLLYLPKFKIEPPAMPLAGALKILGMATAFDERADFGRMTAAKPLYIFDVFHKAFLSLDEEGTEAAAATAEVVGLGIPEPPPKPVEVRVDRPFLFAIQHRASGACLFLGHLTDPR